MWRWIPLALLVLFHALTALRNAIHRRRTGASGWFLQRDRSRAGRVRTFGFLALILVGWVQTIRAALGAIEIAPWPWLRVAGTALGLAGALLMFTAQLQLGDSWRIGIETGARPGLVARGMYRWVRNPIFLWMIVSWVGLALLLFDPLLGVIVALKVLGVHAQVREEERWLVETYGESYRGYAARVGRFLPGVGRLGRSSLPLVLLLAAALAALGALGWFVMRPPIAQVSVPRSASLQQESAAAPAAPLREGARAAESKPPPRPPPIATGTLRIRALDRNSREPIAQLGFAVLRERGGEAVLARGRTGADGRAELRGLEEDTLLVRTERSPPHASTTALARVSADSEHELEILVGRGGAITGRVVDERKLPVAGAALHLLEAQSVFDLPEPLARSGPDGRFRIECAASEPRGLAQVEGEVRAESWKPVPVLAALGALCCSAEALPRPGEDVDIGDLELARAAKFRGRVVDPDLRPVAQALVSLRAGRLVARSRRAQSELDRVLRCGPGDPGFRLLAGETLTDGSGQFELEADGRAASVVVWTRAGALQEFRLPAVPPGERKDEIVLRLDPRTSIELELVDAEGAAAPVPAAQISSGGLWAPWGAAGVFGEGRVSVIGRANGANLAWDSTGVHDADGIWRVQLRVDPARIEELAIHASGYQSLLEHPAAGFQAPIALRLVLEPLPTLRLRLVPEDRGAQLLPAPGEALQLHVCMADPQRHANAALGYCCGSGIFWRGDWRGAELPLVLPLRRKAPFFVHARGRGADGEFRDVASFGPFDPGPEEHELALDPARLALERASSLGHEARVGPGQTDRLARLSARIENARTGKPIPGASLLLEESVAAPRKPRSQRLDADQSGRIRLAPVRAGRWSVQGVVRGYARAAFAERDFTEGETLDLGTLALEPLPAHTGRLLDASGAPVQQAWLVLLDGTSAEIDVSRQSGCTSQGNFSFYGDWPEKAVLHVERESPGPGQPAEAQRFALGGWPESEVRELRLLPTRRVVLLLNNTSASEPPLQVCACPTTDQPTGLCDHRQPIPATHLALATSVALEPLPGMQRCALRLAPGRYQLYGQNLLHALPVTELLVTEGTGDLELTLGVQ